MKVIFNSGNPVDLSAIESMDVSDTDGSVKIVVHYLTSRGVSCNHITFRRPLSDTYRTVTREFTEEMVEEIKSLTQQPDRPIEEVIDLKAWCIGCLSVDINTATDAQATLAFARLCWHWSIGRNNHPSEKQLEKRTKLDTGTINRITDKDDYKRCVENLMKNGFLFKPRTAEEFRAWVAGYRNMPTKFGKRMRLCEDDVETLVESVASYHRIVLPGFSR